MGILIFVTKCDKGLMGFLECDITLFKKLDIKLGFTLKINLSILF